MSVQPNSHETAQGSGGSSTLIIMLAVLVILMAGASGFLGWLYLDNSRVIEDTKILQLNTLREKDSINDELTNLSAQYSLLIETQGEIRSRALDSVVHEKNLEIEALRMQNRSAGMGGNGNNNNSVGGGGGSSAKLKAEVKRLKEELAAFLGQIDQLKSENLTLRNANEKLNSDIFVVRDEVTKLSTVTKELNTQVDIAKHIKISAIKSNAVYVAKSGKEKETEKSKKANKILSCFTVFENDVVESGDKDAHLVIENPSGKILGQDESRSFELDGSPIYYTTQKGFYFEGRKVEMCMDYTDVGDLPKGTYKIKVYIEKRLAAKSNFDLK